MLCIACTSLRKYLNDLKKKKGKKSWAWNSVSVKPKKKKKWGNQVWSWTDYCLFSSHTVVCLQDTQFPSKHVKHCTLAPLYLMHPCAATVLKCYWTALREHWVFRVACPSSWSGWCATICLPRLLLSLLDNWIVHSVLSVLCLYNILHNGILIHRGDCSKEIPKKSQPFDNE